MSAGSSSHWMAIFGADWLRANRVHVTLLNHTDEYVGTPDSELFAVVIADGCALCHTAIKCLISPIPTR